MDLGEAVIVAGIGCRKGVGAAEVLAAVDAALAQTTRKRTDLSCIATAEAKRGEGGLVAAAAALNLPLTVVPMEKIAATAVDRRSAAVEARFGVPSIAEASARAVGGRLILPRIAVGNVTCALAEAAS